MMAHNLMQLVSLNDLARIAYNNDREMMLLVEAGRKVQIIVLIVERHKKLNPFIRMFNNQLMNLKGSLRESSLEDQNVKRLQSFSIQVQRILINKTMDSNMTQEVSDIQMR